MHKKCSVSELNPSALVKDRSRICKHWKKFEGFLLCAAIVIVWGLLSLPVIFYHVQKYQGTKVVADSNISNNSRGITHCSASAIHLSSQSICFPLLYAILRDSCPLNGRENIEVVHNDESTVMQLYQGLQLIGASESCIAEVVPFLCQYLFGLCSDTGYLIQPTSAQCELIRDAICQVEWITAENVGFKLPDCNNLPSTLACPEPQENSTLLPSSGDILKSSIAIELHSQEFECSPGFYRENGSSICNPSCYTWKAQDDIISNSVDGMLLTISFVGFIAAIAVLVISVIRHERMLKFPSILIVYMVLDMTTVIIFIFINFMDRSGLFCSSKNLFESLQRVTPFCVISGMMFTYTSCQMTLWWFFHTATLFWNVLFPFHSRSFEAAGRMKSLHWTCAAIGIFVPILPIVASVSKHAVDINESTNNQTSYNELFWSRGLGFSNTGFPPILCTGSDRDVVFYSVVVPVDIALAVGCTFLLIIFWHIRKKMASKVTEKQNHFKFGTAEKKLLAIFGYYIVLTSVSLTSFSIAILTSNVYIMNIQVYFLCEQGGHDPNNPCIKHFNTNSVPFLTAASFVLIGLLPAVNLIYAININELKSAAQKIWLKRSTRNISSMSLSSGSTLTPKVSSTSLRRS